MQPSGGRPFSRIYIWNAAREKLLNSASRKDIPMKKLTLALFLGILAFIPVRAQTVIVQRPGIFSDLANATGAIVALPLAVVEGIVVGTTEAAGSLLHGSTQIVVVPGPTSIVPAPPIVASPPVAVPRIPAVVPTTTIVTTHSDGTVTTVTRQASAYEHGPVILTPMDPIHRVGSSPLVNPYVFRPQ